MKQSLHRFDQHTTQWIVSLFGQGLRPFFEFITMLGDPIAIVVVTIGVMSAGLYTSSMRLVLSGAIIPLTILIGAVLKMIFERARPITDYAMSMKMQTFSFPSGHSSGSMIAYGLLAYIAFVKLPAPWNYVVACLLAIIPLLVGTSRVYLGAHFPSDVIAGWLLGLCALLITICIVRPFV